MLVARLLGIDIRIHVSWFLIFGLVLVSLSNPRGILAEFAPGWTQRELVLVAAVTALFFFSSVLVHELAHALVARSFRMSVSSITLFLLGGVANLAKEPPSARAEFLMAAAGPLTSLGIGVTSFGVCELVFRSQGGCLELLQLRIAAGPNLFSAIGVVAAYLAFVNVLLAVFNLIPGFPLDGGRVFRSIVWGVTSDRGIATRFAARGGQIVAGLLFLFSVWRLFNGETVGAVWMAMIAYFLYTAASSSLEQERIAATVSGVRVGPLMSLQFRTVHPRSSVAELVETHVLPHNARAVAVVDGERLHGIVTIADLRKVPQRDWGVTPVDRVMTPAEQIPAISPNSRLMTAIERFSGSDIPVIPVVDEGVLVGMLEREAVISYVRMREMLGMDGKR